MVARKPQPASDYEDGTQFREIARERTARIRRHLDEHSATVERIGATDEDPPADHGLEPTERRRSEYGHGATQARDRHAQMADLRLQKIEQHLPRWIGEQLFGKEPLPEGIAHE